MAEQFNDVGGIEFNTPFVPQNSNGLSVIPNNSITDDLTFTGNSATTNESFGLDIDKSATGANVGMGSYDNTLAASLAGQYILGAAYMDPTASGWGPAGLFGTPDQFNITITTLTANRVIGNFNGTLRSNFGSGTATKIVTAGRFDLPIQ